MNILVCDDDKEIVEAIEIYLQQEGYHVLKAYDGEQALDMLKKNEVHLLIIDVMMPKLDGIRATLKIREESSIPIIILSAKSEDSDKILGLNIGADDYVTKPFNPLELVARVKSHLNRYERLTKNGEPQNGTEGREKDVIKIDGIEIHTRSWKVFRDGEEIRFPNREFELLKFLAMNPNIVFSKEELFEKIWGYDYVGDSVTVTVHINRIREKIEEDSKNPKIIETVWGAGYRLNR